jgi:hypothetical protein
MHKLYCYVDESGQTTGQGFVVAVVVLSAEVDTLVAVCEQSEQRSGKGKFKWGKAEHTRRIAYLRHIFVDPRFAGNLRYALFREPVDQHSATIESIARAILWNKPTDRYTTIVYVDGLSKKKRHWYGSTLRKLGMPTNKVQGVAKDENSPLTRLADAIAGFVKDAEEERKGEIHNLFKEVTQARILKEV